MWSVVGSALAARRGQAVIVALVALLAGAALAAAPWYAVAASQRVGVAAVAGTLPEDRLLSVSRRLGSTEPVPADPIGEVRQVLADACAAGGGCDLTGFRSVGSGFVAGRLPGEANRRTELNIAYREEFCDQISVTGACPAAPFEVVVSAAAAGLLGVATGDELELELSEAESHRFRVVGVYEVLDPVDPYWGDGFLVGLGARPTADRHTILTGLDTLAELSRVTYSVELVANPPAFATIDTANFQTGLEPALAELRRQEYAISTSELNGLLARIDSDRRTVVTGVGVGVAVLLLFGWFTLVVLLRNTVQQIRGDVGWWRLHGAPAGRGWVHALGQTGVPLLGGAALGAAAGVAVGRLLADDVAGSAAPRTALQLGLLLVAAAVAGGLVATVATQVGTLRTPVRDLIQRTPARRARWRRSVVDVVLVVLAAASIGQALLTGRAEPANRFETTPQADPNQSGLALLAPGLAVLAIALIAGWAVAPLVAWLAARALRAGRLPVTLVAASMARRPGTHRLFALVAVAVALLTTALLGWDANARTEQARAALEAGADRVVTVASVDSARLLATVRAIDPTGRHAMAVMRRAPASGQPSVLAVDSSRLTVVTGWRQEYGGDVDEVAGALRPPAPEPVLVTGDQLELTAAGADPTGADLYVRAALRSDATGEPVEVVFGPVREEADRFTEPVPPCVDGCRLVGFEVLGFRLANPVDPAQLYAEPATDSWVDLHGIAAGGESTSFTDPTRWRPALGPNVLGPIITGGGDRVRLTVPEPPAVETALVRDLWAFVLDAPAPLPVLAAGWLPRPSDELRIAPLVGAAVPVEIAATARLLPMLGETGLLVDLEYAQRSLPFPAPGATPQVWLSADAPSSIVDDLRAAGLRPVRVDSLDVRLDRLRAEGSAVAVRFQTAIAGVGLVLAAGAVLLLAASERPGWASELAALRAQGVGRRVVRLVGYGGLAAVTGAATAVGLLAGVVGALIARLLHPGFVDGWAVLPAASLRPFPVGGAVVATGLVLGTVVLAAAVALVRRTARLAGQTETLAGRSS
ncbi:MAG TPA: hypothetical protein VIL37_06690 [Natronosporangium sp.]